MLPAAGQWWFIHNAARSPQSLTWIKSRGIPVCHIVIAYSQYAVVMRARKTKTEIRRELIRRNSAIPRVVFSDELLHGNARQRRRMYAIIRGYLREVEQIVVEGRQEGCIRADVDPEAASVLFLGLIQPAVVLWTMSCGEFDIRKQAEAGWRLFVQAIGGTPWPTPDGRKLPKPPKSENAS